MSGQFPEKKTAPRLGLGLGLALELGLGLGGNCPRTIFTGGRRGDFLHAKEMLGFIYLLYVQSSTFL